MSAYTPAYTRARWEALPAPGQDGFRGGDLVATAAAAIAPARGGGGSFGSRDAIGRWVQWHLILNQKEVF
jgi:hypothetical protein